MVPILKLIRTADRELERLLEQREELRSRYDKKLQDIDEQVARVEAFLESVPPSVLDQARRRSSAESTQAVLERIHSFLGEGELLSRDELLEKLKEERRLNGERATGLHFALNAALKLGVANVSIVEGDGFYRLKKPREEGG